MTTPIPIVNPEQLFLQNQQARTIDRPHRQKATEELYAFWTRLRSELSKWDQRLEGLEDASSTLRQSSFRELQHDLERIRKHGLASTLYFDDWPVPESLPVADLRLLHSECTKYSQKLQAYKERLLPKGKFVFQRYREAEAKRRNDAQGRVPLLLSEASSSSFAKKATDDSDTSIQSKSTAARSSRSNHQEYHVGGILENISNANITVSSDGSVHVVAVVVEQAPTPERDASLSALTDDDDTVLFISSSFLLIRNLHHCTLDIHKSIQALHIVESSHVTICVRESIQSAVHITSCQHVQLTAVAQQLRLHESTDLTCRVQWQAGAILEDCTRVVFFVEKTDTDEETNTVVDCDVKDFNWLRTGIPSPNFTIQREERSVPIITAAVEIIARDTIVPVQQLTLQVAASLETDKIEAVVMDSNGVQPVSAIDDDEDDDDDEL